MTPSIQSPKLHRLVEYIKSSGFDLETDELESYGIPELLRDHYGLKISLSHEEKELIRQELQI